MPSALFDGSRYIDLSVHEAGREVCIAEKTVENDAKPYPLLHYVYLGKGYLRIRGKMYQLRAGDCFYIPPGESALYASNEEDPWSYFWVGIGGTKSVPLLEIAGFSGLSPVLHDELRLWKKRFEAIYDSYFESGKLDLSTLAQAYLLLSDMTKSKATAVEEGNKGHIQAAKDYIHNNFQFAISIDDVASSVGVSPNYLANLFQAAGEETPKTYLTRVRMETAAALLINHNSPINEVARAVGYHNPLHFSKIFKQHYGASPQQYRNQGGIIK